MAAYPSIGLQFSIDPINGKRVDISDAGDIRVVNYSEVTAYRIRIKHPLVNATDRDTLLTFYDTNENALNTIDLAGDTYDVRFESAYKVESVSATYFDLSVSLVGNKQ